MLDSCEKYNDYVYHTEDAKRMKYEQGLNEIKLLEAQGVTRSQKY